MATDAENAEAAEAALAAAIAGPKRAKGDAGEVEQHDLDQMIEAEKYQKAKAASAQTHMGLRFVQLKPPGAV